MGYGGRKYGQLYVVDPQEADQHRRQVPANEGVDFELCFELDQMMRSVSPHAQAYRLLREVEQAEQARIAQMGLGDEAIPNVQLVFK